MEFKLNIKYSEEVQLFESIYRCKVRPLFVDNPYNPVKGKGIFDVINNNKNHYFLEFSASRYKELKSLITKKDNVTLLHTFGFETKNVLMYGKLTSDVFSKFDKYIPYVKLHPIEDKGLLLSSYLNILKHKISGDKSLIPFESSYSALNAYAESLLLKRNVIVLVKHG